MMTITQTVKIPADRRLTIDVPPEIPAGFVVLTFASAEAKTQTLRNSASNSEPPYLRLMGCHKDAPNGTVNDFLARCREEKNRELAAEDRQTRGAFIAPADKSVSYA